MTEIRTYSSLIDIHRIIGMLAPIVPIYGTLNGGVQRKTNSEKSKMAWTSFIQSQRRSNY